GDGPKVGLIGSDLLDSERVAEGRRTRDIEITGQEFDGRATIDLVDLPRSGAGDHAGRAERPPAGRDRDRIRDGSREQEDRDTLARDPLVAELPRWRPGAQAVLGRSSPDDDDAVWQSGGERVERPLRLDDAWVGEHD